MNAVAALSGLWDIRTSNGKFFDVRQAERNRWFQKVAPKSGNWKEPIDAVIDADDFDDCNNAAIWYTGGGLTAKKLKGGKLHVLGAGYYVNIGA
jgi:hypothetical protein